jgi:hypothetical protein
MGISPYRSLLFLLRHVCGTPSHSSRIDIISRRSSFAEACGLVNGHVASCFRWSEVQKLHYA